MDHPLKDFILMNITDNYTGNTSSFGKKITFVTLIISYSEDFCFNALPLLRIPNAMRYSS